MILGNNIFISLDAQSAPFAATKSNEIQTECELIEISSPNVGKWRKFLAGRNEWSFTVSWLYGNINKIKLLESMIGQEVFIAIYGRDGGNIVKLLEGSAICKHAKTTLSEASLAIGSFSFQGNGELKPIVMVESISLSAQQINLSVGGSSTNPVSATVTPNDATNKNLTWASSDSSVAVVTQNGDNYTINAVGSGTCQLKATSTDGSNVSASCEVVVGLE